MIYTTNSGRFWRNFQILIQRELASPDRQHRMLNARTGEIMVIDDMNQVVLRAGIEK